MKWLIFFRKTSCFHILLLSTIYSFVGVNCAALSLESNKSKYVIMIDVNSKQLSLVDKELQETIKTYPVATGKKGTPSPLGTWVISDKGRKKEAYFGTRWMGLNVPWGGYGIHGTNRPGSIGLPVSNGCFRMHTKDIEELYNYISEGTVVIIEGGPYGPFGNGFRVIKPGDFGSDVYEVQRFMKLKGYYPGAESGIYKQDMKELVLKFRKDNNLEVTDEIDDKFYGALGIELMD
jgi:hypothetical protein